MKIAIVGGGVFGLSAAWRLGVRNHDVAVFEADRVPAHQASSRDVSKALRGGYGSASATYAPGVARARELWIDLEALTGSEIFHRTGCLQLSTRFAPGTFEFDGHEILGRMGWPLEVVEPGALAERLPGFSMAGVEAGVLDHWGGWLDPMTGLPALAEASRRAGATILERHPVADPRCLLDGHDAVLVCAGPWLPDLLELGVGVRATRQHEAFYRPKACPGLSRLPAWSLDMASGGWYGFPPTSDGMVKVARHVPDEDGDPSEERRSDPRQAEMVRAFVVERMPELADAPDEGTTCFYTMSPDGSFVFDEVPDAPGLFVAGCGGGHAFKFGPMLGEWAADLIEGQTIPEDFRLASKGVDRVV